ncbi:contact-dependent growth inhibition system immunity protein [Sungkyunkwania multivorans]|uniref:Contact-dependent growth inhibition system immunity protein n=1 Tax=Sungkyunkwania multivorans TaxID=1173618 RepID=A0ABW3D2Y1_9FLAO
MKTTETKYENNWLEKSLENLEKDYWGKPDYESHLVKTCHQLRKKPLKDFEIEDLRIMIGQNIGLKFLIPLALEKLRQDILAEGDYYEGDLLKAVLTSEIEFWNLEPKLTKELEAIISDNEELLNEREPDLLKSYEQWKKN